MTVHLSTRISSIYGLSVRTGLKLTPSGDFTKCEYCSDTQHAFCSENFAVSCVSNKSTLKFVRVLIFIIFNQKINNMSSSTLAYTLEYSQLNVFFAYKFDCFDK